MREAKDYLGKLVYNKSTHSLGYVESQFLTGWGNIRFQHLDKPLGFTFREIDCMIRDLHEYMETA